MTATMTGYCVAERKIDDNGNWYYDRLSDAWATVELARQWARYMGLDTFGAVEIVPADQERM